MTWFLKTFVFCATLILLGFALDVWGYTQWTCKRKCKDEPDNLICGRWMATADGSQYAPGMKLVPKYKWLRNECERKCYRFGDYNETVAMDVCNKAGQNYTTYRCSDEQGYPDDYQECLRNKSMH